MQIKRTKLKGNLVRIQVSPGEEQRSFGEAEVRYKREFIELCEMEEATLIFNGVESWGVNRIPAALALDALRKIPTVYDGTFTEFDPTYGIEYKLEDFKQAEAALLSSSETYGTDVQARGQQLRRGMIVGRPGLIALAERLAGVIELALDLETFPIIEGFLKRDIGDTRLSDVRLISLSDGAETWLIDTVACGQNIEPLRHILETKPLIVHNAQFDCAFLADKYGIVPRGGVFDTVIAARVLSNEAPISVFRHHYRKIVEVFGEDMINPKEFEWEPPGEEEEEDPQPLKKERVVFQLDWYRVSNTLDAVLERFLDIRSADDESTSDWEAERLTDRQLVYSSEDVLHLSALKRAILSRKMVLGELVSDERDLDIIRLDLGTLECCLSMYREGSRVDLVSMEAAYKQRKLDEAAALRRALRYAAETYGLELSKDQAVDMRDDWFALYPRLIRWHEEAREAANNYAPYGETLLGRKRRIHPMSGAVGETWAGFQARTNHAVQGSCADMLKLALIEIHQTLDPDRARLIGCVHDEVLVYARNDALEATKTLVKEAMENAGVKVFGDEIKFLAEVKSGGDWDL